ncbi:MAG TPA: hypothetical protein DCX25_02515 [Candidatus Pacebacteria bacterium]|nr:MAG: hypothetical protein UX00_C0004G0074 [Microgenomates group bacterium GW2011_GWB1_45_17]KKU23928.1 MAG: hypothetical protein UX35_C0003G0064 [Microgenomates group bacterium GW2011_GWA1_46_15]KKU24679.1 MAG: hypothetical protein UX36_C0001G0296 [Microgenomates group bacterium GW2011_GWC1_46_15]HAV15177.1 hypothetical protein [Candidatus Paceibacterota bacterium]HCR11112.1 hypothetical protein [Candidatus Paceibacterota bacterium]
MAVQHKRVSLRTKLYSIFVISLFLLTIFFRAYHFSQNIQFDQDFGRDSLYAMRMLNGKLTLLGPQASVGGFYLAPLYFYLVAAVYGLVGYIPQTMSVVFISMGIATVWIGFHLQKTYFSRTAALLFLIFVVTHQTLVIASRSATNQPIIPLVTVVTVLAYMAALQKKTLRSYLYVGLAYGLYFHVHFSGLLLFPALLLLTFIQNKGTVRYTIQKFIAVGLGIFIMLSPLVFFDLRHNLITTKAFVTYISASAEGKAIATNLPHWNTVEKIQHTLKFFSPNMVLSLLIIGLAGVCAVKMRERHIGSMRRSYLMALGVFSLSSIAFIFVYRGYLFDYYVLSQLTVSLLFVSALLSLLRPRMIAFGLVSITAIFFLRTLDYSPKFRTIANLRPIMDVMETDLKKSPNKPFAVFQDSVDGLSSLAYSYRFLFERDGFHPVSEYFYEQATVLYVVAEGGEINPALLGNFEVRMFGPGSYALLQKVHTGEQDIFVYRVEKHKD